MLWLEKAAHWMHGVDFACLVPAIARLPLPLGQKLALIRGLLCGMFDYEWRSRALGKKFVREKTTKAMQMIEPKKGYPQAQLATLRRFVQNSREEWQSCLFTSPVMEDIARRSCVKGVEHLFQARKQSRGVVLLSCHLDSFCMGMAILGMRGMPTHCLNTVMIEDTRIHPKVRSFFQNKYRGMEALMGGSMAYHETHRETFYLALERSEVVVLMGDVPGGKSSIRIPFLGADFRLPLGAWHMARQTQSLVGGYVCLCDGVGQYRMIILPPAEIDPESPEKTLRPVYEFLEEWIRRYPERWIASDLLPGYS